jgi:RimJ/RimL family protein N-acetyltransferase
LVSVPELESERLVLRRWRPEDVADYAVVLADPAVMRFMGSGWRHRAKRAAARVVARFSDLEARRAVTTLVRHWDRHGYGEWAVVERATGALVGRVGFVHHADWPAGPAKVEIGWTLISAAWGRGYATEAARVALDSVFERNGFERIISISYPGNERSLRVMQRLGMRRQGTARWRGAEMVWYAIDRDEWLAARRPATPQPTSSAGTAR